jgi:two-component sensor histidine kinase
VRALSATQAALSRNNWVGVALSEIVATETTPYVKRGGDNFQAQGPHVVLTPRAALSMALTLHELTTNAAKHGALSWPEGRVALRWKLAEIEGGPKLVLEWKESGGPEVQPPTHSGFGRRLIEQATAYELGAATTLDFRPSGVRCRIAVPARKALSALPADGK